MRGLGRFAVVSSALLLGGCPVDDRTLGATGPACGDDCIDFGGVGGDETHTSGKGGSSSSAGDPSMEEVGAGFTSYGGAGGGTLVGPDGNCPDLDQNTILDCSETLAENSTFDSDISGWAPEANGAISWVDNDWLGSTDSGSIRVKNRAQGGPPNGGLAMTAAKQCVPITDDRAYVIYAQMYLRGPLQLAFGSVVGRVFPEEDCAGSPLALEPSTIQNTVDRWVTLQVAIPASHGAKSLLVELSVGKAGSTEDEVSIDFDNVLAR